MEMAPVAVFHKYAMLKKECFFLFQCFIPCINSGLCIIRMNSICPAIALVLFVSLTGEGCPARLLAYHFTGSIIGPQNAINCSYRSLEPLLAFFHFLLC